MADIAGDVAGNPDAQAAVTDFLDYTEYLPADLIRSLTLIRGLDETYLRNSHAVHDLTKTYGALPTLPPHSRPSAHELRSQISTHLDQALNARESAYAEACRLFDLTERHQSRLKSVIAKLKALPKPPSRDPTPQPQSPNSAKRSRTGRKLETGPGGTRLTLKLPKGPAISLLSRPKHHRVTVPGEVLPPYDPDEPIASTEASDWESDHAPAPIRPVLKLKQSKPPKLVVETVERKPREIATYRKPTPPPEDAELGGLYRPWTHLTEYEMYKLRKKMKKNHTWDPSEVMIRRELNEKGRGWENYHKAKAEAQANETAFIEIRDVDRFQTGELVKAETPKNTPITVVTPTMSALKTKKPNRTEPKKDKKEDVVASRASLAAQEAELAARRLGNFGSAFKNIFSSALASLNRGSSTPSASNSNKKPSTEKSQKKRKIDEANVSESPTAEADGQRKKQKLIIPIPKAASVTPAPVQSAGTIKIPLKLTVNPPQPSISSTASSPISSSRAVSAHRGSVAPKIEASPVPSSRPPLSRRSTAASIEPSTVTTTTSTAHPSRRASVTPATSSRKAQTPAVETTPKALQTAASRRSKRDAPGTVTQSSQDGGVAVSVSQRKAKPKAQKSATDITINTTAAAQSTTSPPEAQDENSPQIRIDVDGNQELVDPDEARFCVCGDVSWGEMILCELEDKCEFGEWFHMECINLIEHPPRTAKWYCPGDREKYHKGETSNGLVGRGIK